MSPGSSFFYSSIIPFLESFLPLNQVLVLTWKAFHSSRHLQMVLFVRFMPPCPCASCLSQRSQLHPTVCQVFTSTALCNPAPVPGSGCLCSLPFLICHWNLDWEIFKAGSGLGVWKNISPSGCCAKDQQYRIIINQGQESSESVSLVKEAVPQTKGWAGRRCPAMTDAGFVTVETVNKETPVWQAKSATWGS